MNGLICIREEVHNAVLNFRTIENIISRPKFARLWMDSTGPKQEEVRDILRKGDRHALAKWMKEHPAIGLEQKTLVQLRLLGRKLGIKYYASLQQSELVAEIIKREDENVRFKGSIT